MKDYAFLVCMRNSMPFMMSNINAMIIAYASRVIDKNNTVKMLNAKEQPDTMFCPLSIRSCVIVIFTIPTIIRARNSIQYINAGKDDISA